MRKRTWISLAVAVAVIAALLVTAYVRRNAAPEVARLLPDADGIVFLNLKPLRTLTRFGEHPVAHDPEYQAFINATGIEFERDLDQAAFALHRMANPNGPNGALAYSEVFRGRFNGPRLTSYLAAHAASQERYAGHEIYSIQHDGRTVRVAVLGYDLVSVSNTPDDGPIHSIIDRYHASASPFSGSALLSEYYHYVPLLSQAWAIARIGAPLTDAERFHVLGLAVPLPPDSTFIASIRYLGALHVRVEEIAASAQAASTSAQMATMALAMLRAAQAAPGDGSQAATVQEWNALLASARVERKDTHTIVTAKVPEGLVRALFRQPEAAAQAPAGNPQPLP
jgi:hypothetical protein